MAAGAFRLTGLGLGTVGDPALQFTADTNTGIYSSAADTVNVATGGALAAQFGASAIIAAAPEDARTATVDVAQIIRSTTSGVPAANIGVGLQFDAESADENPSVFGRIDFVATDVTAASEDTVMDILLRTAGAAEASRYRFQATGAFLATITHAITAARTYTFPDSTGTMITTADGVRTLNRTATDVAFVDSAAENTLYTFSVPGGTLGTTAMLKLTWFGNVETQAATITFRLKYGATTVATAIIAAIANVTVALWGEAYLAADGATNAQDGHVICCVGDGGATAMTFAQDDGTAAEDSTGALSLVLTSQHASAVGDVRLFHAVLEHMP